jgi:hypothetical protein
MVGKCAVCSSFDDLIVFFAGCGENAAPAILFRANCMGGDFGGQADTVMP